MNTFLPAPAPISEAELRDLSKKYGLELTEPQARAILRMEAEGLSNPVPSFVRDGIWTPEWLK